MANEEQVRVLRKGGALWNSWRASSRADPIDLSNCVLQSTDLSGANLTGANLSGVNFLRTDLRKAILCGANLTDARLSEADLTEANLEGAALRQTFLWDCKLENANLVKTTCYQANFMKSSLRGANLSEAKFNSAVLVGADLSDANLTLANLFGANLIGTNLSRADLTGANLSTAVLVRTVLNEANLTGCTIYGISAWDVQLERAIQFDLIITSDNAPKITVDNLEVAQFIYLLLNNQKIRHVIDSITSKVVLILGRFTPERKPILDAIRDQLRKRDYLPVLFDFEKPSNKTTLETVSTLAHMARFVIADLTDAKSVLQELQAIVPSNPSVPIQPVIINSQTEPGMFDFFRIHPWVLEPYLYEDQDRLLAAINDKVIGPAEKKAKEQTGR